MVFEVTLDGQDYVHIGPREKFKIEMLPVTDTSNWTAADIAFDGPLAVYLFNMKKRYRPDEKRRLAIAPRRGSSWLHILEWHKERGYPGIARQTRAGATRKPARSRSCCSATRNRTIA